MNPHEEEHTHQDTIGGARRAHFTIVPDFIAEMLFGHGNERLVYDSLAFHSDERGYSWPSHALIARETGLSVTTVQRTLKKLMAREGFRQVRRTRSNRGQTANGYYIPIHRPVGHGDRGGSVMVTDELDTYLTRPTT